MKQPERKQGFARKPAAKAFSGYSDTHLYREIKEGRFPAPIKLSPQISAWDWEDLYEWYDKKRIRSEDAA